jgi:imidazolonepropionase-like amidohydrolase
MGVIKIIGGKVINRGEYTCADVIINEGKIISVGSHNINLPDDVTVIDANGK